MTVIKKLVLFLFDSDDTKICKFPFIYKNTTYNECTSIDNEDEECRCSTSVDALGMYNGNSQTCKNQNCTRGISGLKLIYANVNNGKYFFCFDIFRI